MCGNLSGATCVVAVVVWQRLVATIAQVVTTFFLFDTCVPHSRHNVAQLAGYIVVCSSTHHVSGTKTDPCVNKMPLYRVAFVAVAACAVVAALAVVAAFAALAAFAAFAALAFMVGMITVELGLFCVAVGSLLLFAAG